MLLDRDTLALAGATLHLPAGAPADFRHAVRRVSHDSRRVEAGDLFVGIRTPERNGSDFHPMAVERGAAFLLLDRLPDPLVVPCAVAADPFAALVALARIARGRATATVVSMTGSSGKTTTKEMTAAILATAGRVHTNRGNYNNLLGLSISLVEAPAEAEFLVLEVGTSAAGEIAQLTDLARPEIGILTIVGHSHLEFFKTLDAVREEKFDLVRGLVGRKCAIVNADDPRQATFVAGPGTTLVRYAASAPADPCGAQGPRTPQGPACDVYGDGYAPDGEGCRFTVRAAFADGPVAVRLPVPGRHMMMNALAALAAGHRAGVPVATGARALATFAPAAQRMNLRTVRGVTVVDDSYNANPDSVRMALLTARDLPCRGRRIAALGDMLELGAAGPELHRGIGRLAAEAGFDRLIAVGPLMLHAADAARAAGLPPASVRHFPDSAAARTALAELAAGDLLLVKGSHGMKMERLVDNL